MFDFAHPPDVELPLGSCCVQLVQLEDLRKEALKNEALRGSAIRACEGFIESALRDHYLSQKEAPVLRDFGKVEEQLLKAVSELLPFLENSIPSEALPKLKTWAEKLVKKNLHSSREHLRAILRRASRTDDQKDHPL